MGVKTNTSRHEKRTLPIAVLALFAVFVTLIGIIYAKYVTMEQSSDGVVSNRFFFTSDYLTEDGAVYDIYGDSVVFNLYNNDGLNYTDQNNIRYKITTSGGHLDYTSVTYNDTVPQLARSSSPGSKHTYTLDRGNESSITVTVTSVAAYRKTMSATFNFIDTGTYSIIDSTHYIIVDLYTGGNPPADGVQEFSFKNLIGDSSNPITNSASILGEAVSYYTVNPLPEGASIYWKRPTIDTQVTEFSRIKLEPNTHYQLIFFKLNAHDVTEVANEPLVSPLVIN